MKYLQNVKETPWYDIHIFKGILKRKPYEFHLIFSTAKVSHTFWHVKFLAWLQTLRKLHSQRVRGALQKRKADKGREGEGGVGLRAERKWEFRCGVNVAAWSEKLAAGICLTLAAIYLKRASASKYAASSLSSVRCTKTPAHNHTLA